MIEHANAIIPRSGSGGSLSLKAMLAVGKNFIFLGKVGDACALYDNAATEGDDWLARSPALNNNLGVCAVKRAFERSMELGGRQGHEPGGDPTALHWHTVAAESFAAARRVAEKSEAELGPVEDRTDDTMATVVGNAEKFVAWVEFGGNFEGSLMW